MPPKQRDSSAVELDRLADGYDAVADVLLAEAVHQNVLGNNERAGAALAALDRQGRPPRIDFVRTPRTGKSYTQRLLVLIGDEALPPSWPRPGPRRARRGRAPAQRLARPHHRRPAAGPVRRRGRRHRRRSSASRSTSSGCRPLSAVLASHRPGRDEPSELEERLRQRVRRAAPAPTAADRPSTLLDDPPPGRPGGPSASAPSGRCPAGRTRSSRRTARPTAARPRPAPGRGRTTGSTTRELGTRADALAAAYAAAHDDGSRRRRPVRAPTAQQLSDALVGGGRDLGVDGSVPRRRWTAHDGRRRSARRPGVAADHAAAAARDRDWSTGGATPTRAGRPPDRADPRLARRAVPGAAAVHRRPIPSRCGRRSPPGPRCCAGDDLAPGAWLRADGAGARRASTGSRGSAAPPSCCSSDVVPRDLAVAPAAARHRRTLARPALRPRSRPAELAVVAHTSGTVDFAAPLAGLFVDALDRDHPGPRGDHRPRVPPRRPGRAGAAVGPARRPAGRDRPGLERRRRSSTPLIEAHDLARIRGVGPDRLEWLGTMLPGGRAPRLGLTRRARGPPEAAGHDRDRGGLSHAPAFIHLGCVARVAGPEHRRPRSTRWSRLEGLPLSADLQPALSGGGRRPAVAALPPVAVPRVRRRGRRHPDRRAGRGRARAAVALPPGRARRRRADAGARLQRRRAARSRSRSRREPVRAPSRAAGRRGRRPAAVDAQRRPRSTTCSPRPTRSRRVAGRRRADRVGADWQALGRHPQHRRPRRCWRRSRRCGTPTGALTASAAASRSSRPSCRTRPSSGSVAGCAGTRRRSSTRASAEAWNPAG